MKITPPWTSSMPDLNLRHRRTAILMQHNKASFALKKVACLLSQAAH